jgi:putative IMPACT (imprinted ancient) family translation regulator
VLNSGAVRYSDDGEPQGTAGQPMLGVFQKEGVTDVVCVVTRYFGGVLLGAGGLCRAYTKSAKDALDAAGISVVRRWTELKVPCPYSLFAQVGQEAESAGGVVTDTEYAADVTLTVLLREGTEISFQRRLLDLSAGTVTAEVTGEALRAVPL